MPPKVASAGRSLLDGNFKSHLHENYDVSIYPSTDKSHIEKFWEVDDNVLSLAEKLSYSLPSSGQELIRIAKEEGCEDIFPSLSKEEKSVISADGKIPVYMKWADKISNKKIAPDTLLNLAGLASFTTDQEKLDERILSIIA